MTADDDKRDARVEALIGVVGSLLAVIDIKSDAADLWPETMRKGTPGEIRRVTAALADVLPAARLRDLRPLP